MIAADRQRLRALRLAKERDVGGGIVATQIERACAVRALYDRLDDDGRTVLLGVLERLPRADLRRERTIGYAREMSECADRLRVGARLDAVDLSDLDLPRQSLRRQLRKG